MVKNKDSLFDTVKQKASSRSQNNWYNKIGTEALQQIRDAYSKCKDDNIPIIVLAEVIKEKYKLKQSTESVLRTITRRIV